MYVTTGVTYEKATVLKIVDEALEPSDDGRMLGQQTALVKITSGMFEGEEMEVKSYLSNTHNIYVEKGDDLILYVAYSEGISPLLQVYGYDHTSAYAMVAVLFLILMALVGGKKGLKSVLGMVFSGYFLYTFLIPFLCTGASPIVGALLYSAVSASVCLLLLNGMGVKTMTAILSTFIGLVSAALCYGLVSNLVGVSGYHVDEVESLLLVSAETGLQVEGLLFGAILVSTLGAVMDMTMSITTALFELERTNGKMTPKQLMDAGFEMGRDMAGTMVETLVFAFVGTAFITLIMLWVTGTQPTQIIHSNFIATEYVSAVVGSSSVVLTVPITVGCYLFARRQFLVEKPVLNSKKKK